ncbi:bifunctional DNA-formamidopyrimidine glycosylase/DNA-(apurinic or apyrimidinic site) lyase [Prescottella agglutinans]|uniref:Formamidopyrimidine-DNA glycosylase n=1 Tax=Prescottella agglutinans TaxID=1644129 RepID=A0ABT6MCX2_9NOCA|nr:bifunctional DNA-formamidopyrimidine glycosylase/DNA-(apurinic or apyrimidinic site) lyase [Prescottella agglutinans]MDH6282166.1 formamidopyrimidine-DNA glycosylase [Prescottella agglutinans]
MPELPEVEVVRRGLEAHVVGRVIDTVDVLHPRAVRRHLPGSIDLARRLEGRTIASAERRGKYLWLVLEPDDVALVVHLGMSGQMLVQDPTVADEKHLRIRARLDSGTDLRFVDQRTFGGWALADLVTVDGTVVPDSVAHIARDPLDPRFDPDRVVKVLRGKQTEIKRALLDQTVVSGVGNIYADEALWRAEIHGNRPTDKLTGPRLRRLLVAVESVMQEALAQGGTSFDALYVNVNGQSGYFDRSLAAYGQENLPCQRCGAPIVREKFMNRSSYSCPKCQPRPRLVRGSACP